MELKLNTETVIQNIRVVLARSTGATEVCGSDVAHGYTPAAGNVAEQSERRAHYFALFADLLIEKYIRPLNDPSRTTFSAALDIQANPVTNEAEWRLQDDMRNYVKAKYNGQVEKNLFEKIVGAGPEYAQAFATNALILYLNLRAAQ